MNRTIGRLPGALLVVLLAILTYPGADLVAFATRIAPQPAGARTAPGGALEWLHV